MTVCLKSGPGIGTMTQFLCENAANVIAVEIDKALIPVLNDTLSRYDNVKVIQGDILKQDICELSKTYNGGRSFKMVANLPYYITTPIIMGILENDMPIDSITVMVQKEVAMRMQADRVQRITVHYHLPFSIMQNRILLQMYRRIVLCRDLMWQAQS